MEKKTFGAFTKEENDTFLLTSNAFYRRGAWFGVYARPQRYASPANVGEWSTTDLFIGTRRASAAQLASNLLMQLIPVKDGVQVAYSVTAKAEELTVNTAYGKIRFCFAETGLIMVKGENGLGLRLEKDLTIHQMAKRRGEHGWETSFGYVCSIVYNPVIGTLDMNAPWDFERLSSPQLRAEVKPDENGVFLLSIEESRHLGRVREKYPTYEEALADVTNEWQTFLSHRPALGEKYAADREETAYLTWSHLADPTGLVKRPILFMRQESIASSWQMCETAVVLKDDFDLAIELFLNMLDAQSPNGQIPDMYSDATFNATRFKPPIQGWALEMLMRYHDFAAEVPRDKLLYMYEGYSKWADWFTKYRDDDHDGIPQLEHGDETGNDDSPLFHKVYAVDDPEIAAMLALLYEKLGDLAGILGKEDEKKARYAQSRETIDKMIAMFWNGERFIAREHENHDNIIDVKSVQFYRILMLGKRLPQEIIDRMAADLAEEDHYLTPYGFRVEDLHDSPYSVNGTGRGKILPSDNIIIITGLYLSGKVEQAKEAAKRYIEGFHKCPTMYYAGGFIGSWSAAGFQILANLLCNGLE